MPRETQKEKIERLEKCLLERENKIEALYQLIDEKLATISAMQTKSDEEFSNSPYKKQLENKLFILEEKLRLSQEDNSRLKERALAKDQTIEVLEEKYKALEGETQDLNIKIAKKICEKLDVEKTLGEVQDKLKTAEYWNRTNNIGELTLKACRQEKSIKELEEEIQKLKNEKSLTKNARGAGRKSLLGDKKEEIKRLRLEGLKIKELAERYDCSTGLIHKLINE